MAGINVDILCKEGMLQKMFKTQFLKFYFCVQTDRKTHTHIRHRVKNTGTPMDTYGFYTEYVLFYNQETSLNI